MSSTDGQACVEVELDTRRCFRGVALHQITFSPDSRHVAYPVEDGEGWRVVRDGEPGPVVEGVGELAFTPDGSTLVYAAEREGAWHMVVDDSFGRPFDSLAAGTLTFDLAGDAYAFVAYVGSAAVVVLDGAVLSRHDGVAQLRFAPAGGRLGYLARDAGEVSLYVNGTPRVQDLGVQMFAFGPSGDLAYGLWSAAGVRVVHGDRRFGPYSDVRALTFHPGDGTLAFVARDDTGERVVFDGEEGPAYSSVDPPAFSERGSRWGYVAWAEDRSVVVVDGEAIDERAAAGGLVFSRDGERYAYVARSQTNDAVVDEGGLTPFDMVVDGTLHFTPSGVWSCLAGDLRHRRLYVTVEDHPERRPFEWFDFALATGASPQEDSGSEALEKALRAWVSAEAALILDGVR